MTPTYTADDVRRLLLKQIETLNAFKAARLFWGGVSQQGAQIGDRTFDVREGASTPTGMMLAATAEEVRTEYVIRLAHPIKPKQDPNEAQLRSRDVREVANRVREQNMKIPAGMMVFWLSSDAPALDAGGTFVYSDIKIAVQYWSWVSGPPDAVVTP